MHVRGDERAFPLASRSHLHSWEPLGLTPLYHEDLEWYVTQLRKVDETLADLWTRRLKHNQTRVGMIALEAELQRMRFSPAHLHELMPIVNFLEQLERGGDHELGAANPDVICRFVNPDGSRGDELRAAGYNASSPMPCEQALLELEGYRRANAAEGEQLAAELEASGAALRRATRGCKLSVGALCKRSMGKTRKLIIVMPRRAYSIGSAYSPYLPSA